MFITILFVFGQKLTANPEIKYLNKRLDYNKKIITAVNIFQGAAALEAVYCMYQLFFNKKLSRYESKYYDNHWTLDSIAILVSYLYLNQLNKESAELEKQISDLDQTM